jgi:hypothetical protein
MIFRRGEEVVASGIDLYGRTLFKVTEYEESRARCTACHLLRREVLLVKGFAIYGHLGSHLRGECGRKIGFG